MHFLEQGHYGILALIVILELSALNVVPEKSASSRRPTDTAIERPIKSFSNKMLLQTFYVSKHGCRLSFYAKHIKPSYFTGEQHFSYHNKDGAQPNTWLFFYYLIRTTHDALLHTLCVVINKQT